MDVAIDVIITADVLDDPIRLVDVDPEELGEHLSNHLGILQESFEDTGSPQWTPVITEIAVTIEDLDEEDTDVDF